MILKFMRGATLSLCAVLGSVLLAGAQAHTSPFTVLSNNADVANKRLYVEVMYEKLSCDDYKAQFRLVSKANPAGDVIPVDSFLNNSGTYETELSGTDKYKSLMRPTAGGYRLRFALPSSASLSDSFRICVDAYKMAYRCKGCAAGGSDAIFSPLDIAAGCPYQGSDVLACYKRESAEGNWEAWIQDPRDCEPYRVVAMPDGRWWFAQNLNYQKDLTMYAASNNGPTVAPATSDAGFWCPGGKSFTTAGVTEFANATATSGGLVSCKTYGALYTWTTANSLNGRSKLSPQPAVGAMSTAQGICPDGWLMPSEFDWGVLLNAVEGCPSPSNANGTVPCNHARSDAAVGYMGSQNAKSLLKNTRNCPPHATMADTVCASLTQARWTWRRVDYGTKLATPLALGSDRYGFALLPSGYRVNDGSAFAQAGTGARFWSAGESGTSGYARNITNNEKTIELSLNRKDFGQSVRCVKDGTLGDFFLYPAGGTTIAMAATAPSIGLGCLNLGAGWSYAWTVTPQTNVTLSASGANATLTANATLQVGANYTITVVATKSGEPSHTASKVLNVVATPPVELPKLGLAGIYANPTDAGSRNAAIKLSAYSAVQPSGATYAWSATARTPGAPAWTLGNSTTSGLNATTPSVTTQSTYTITVTMKAAGYQTASVSMEYVIRGCDAITQGAMPAEQTVCPGAGALAALNPSVTGGDTYTFQWQQRVGSASWTDIAGATSQSYTPTAPTTANQLVYYRRVVNSCGQTSYSTEWKLMTYGNISQPGNLGLVTACVGVNVTRNYGVATGGTGAFTYLWQSSTDNNTWANATGTNNGQTYTFSTASIANNSFIYHRRIATSSTCPTLTHTGDAHATKVLNVGPALAVTASTVTACPGQTNIAVPTVTITGNNGSGITAARWQRLTVVDGVNSGWADDVVLAPTGATFSATHAAVTALNSSGGALYQRLLATSCGIEAATGNVLTVTSLGITANPVAPSQTACPSSSVTLSPAAATAAAGATVTYKWQSSTSATGSFFDVVGAAGAFGANQNLTVNAPATEGTIAYYRRVARASCGGTLSDLLGNPMSITAQAAITQPVITDIQTCAGKDTMFVAGAATGAPGITYRWQQFNANTNAWSDMLPAVTTQNLSVKAPSTAGTYSPYYRRVASAAGCGNVAGSAARIYALPATVEVGNLPSLFETGANTPVSLAPPVKAVGNAIYQWQSSQDNQVYSPVAGANTPVLEVLLTGDGEYSPYYKLKASAACGDVSSVGNAIRVFTSLGCPYKGADLVDGSCVKRATGAQNWQASVKDNRDNRTYRIVQMPGGDWWFAQNLAYKNEGKWQYNVNDDPSTYEELGLQYPYNNQPCPNGWRAPEASDWEKLLNCVNGDCSVKSYNINFDVDGRELDGKNSGVLITRLRAVESWGGCSTTPSIGTDNFGFSLRYGEGGDRRALTSTGSDYCWTAMRASTSFARNLWYNANTNAVGQYSRGPVEEMKTCCAGTGAYVRCIADTLVSQSTAPEKVEATYIALANNGTIGTTTLTAKGGVAASGSIYRWGTGSVGSNIIAGQSLAVLSNVSPAATTTYWVQRSNSDGTWASGAATIEITVQPCPYTGTDRVQPELCRQRGLDEQNWEAYFRDSRDSKTYRMVLMPDRQWWMAQSLNYTTGLSYAARPDLPTTSQAAADMPAGAYWCPQQEYVGSTYTQSSGGAAACNVWGAVYPWGTAMRANGTGALATATDARPSGVQGICPSGWHMPSYKEYTYMWDCVGGNCNSGIHNGYGVWNGNSGQKLKGKNVGTPSASNMAWVNYNGTNGTDTWGFSAYPASLRWPSGEGLGHMGTYNHSWTASQYPYDANSGMYVVYTYSEVGSYYGGTVKSHGMSVRCVSNSAASGNKSTPPTVLMASYTGISLGSSTTLTAMGAVPSTGAQYQWGRGGVIGTNQISRTADNALNVTPASVSDSIFWVRMVESDGTTFVGGVTLSIRVQPAACPYRGADVVAGSCRQRTSGARNWTAQVTDSRDGQVYPVVLMPDGRWWLGRNLTYTAGLTKAVSVDQPTTITSGNWDLYKGYYWCQNESSTTLSGGDADCQKYGVLYPWQTVMSNDGIGVTNAATEEVPSKVRGVCPMGWHVASALEAYKMLDCVEGNCDINTYSAASAVWKGSFAGDHLRGAATFAVYNTGVNKDSYGFSAQASGYRNSSALGARLTDNYIWFASEMSANEGSVFVLNYTKVGVYTARNHNKYHGFAIRCVSNGEAGSPPVTTAPTAIESDVLVSGTNAGGTNGAGAVLTAVGGTLENGATHEWGVGTVVGASPIAGETGSSLTRQINATSNSYWVRRVSPTTGPTAGVAITIPTQTCPYPGADMVTTSCRKSATTNRWEAIINDGRPLGNSMTYPIAQLGAGNRWWTMQAMRYGDCATSGSNLAAGGRCISCGGVSLYNGFGSRAGAAAADATNIQGICPTGWRLPGMTEARDQLANVKGTEFNTAELSTQSYATPNADRCFGNSNMHYSHSGGYPYYWSNTGVPNISFAVVADGTDSYAVRCIYASTAISGTPSHIMGPDLLQSGRTATLTAVGATLAAGAVYQWSSNSNFTPLLASGAAATTYTTPALAANATYWVRIMDASGVPTEAKSIAINITTTCPYTGSDLVAGSCTNRATGWQNFTANIWSGGTTGRANDRAQYPIVRMPNGQWWFARNLVWTGASGTTGQWFGNAASADAAFPHRYYSTAELGGANADYNVPQQGPCPGGWHVATFDEWVYNGTVFPNTPAGQRALSCANDDGGAEHIWPGSDPLDTYGFCFQGTRGYWDGGWQGTSQHIMWTVGSYHYRAYPNFSNSVSPSRNHKTPVRCVR